MSRIRQWLFPILLLAMWAVAVAYTVSLLAKNPEPGDQQEISQPAHQVQVSHPFHVAARSELERPPS